MVLCILASKSYMDSDSQLSVLYKLQMDQQKFDVQNVG